MNTLAQNEMVLEDVDRVHASIGREEFARRYIKTGRPAVILGLSESWPAFEKWTPEFFIERFGDREITVASRDLPAPRFNPGYGGLTAMKMREYIHSVLEEERDLRLAARNTRWLVKELESDFSFPELGRSYKPFMTWLFFGCKSSRTFLHFDFGCFHIFHACFAGTKTFYLFPNNQSSALHRIGLSLRSNVDAAKPDYEAFPRLRNARGYRVDITKGEVLYMPPGMWHDVRYQDGGIALTLRFTENQRLIMTRLFLTGLAAFGGAVIRQLLSRGKTK